MIPITPEHNISPREIKDIRRNKKRNKDFKDDFRPAKTGRKLERHYDPFTAASCIAASVDQL
jgi:hypothetical protein